MSENIDENVKDDNPETKINTELKKSPTPPPSGRASNASGRKSGHLSNTSRPGSVGKTSNNSRPQSAVSRGSKTSLKSGEIGVEKTVIDNIEEITHQANEVPELMDDIVNEELKSNIEQVEEQKVIDNDLINKELKVIDDTENESKLEEEKNEIDQNQDAELQEKTELDQNQDIKLQEEIPDVVGEKTEENKVDDTENIDIPADNLEKNEEQIEEKNDEVIENAALHKSEENIEVKNDDLIENNNDDANNLKKEKIEHKSDDIIDNVSVENIEKIENLSEVEPQNTDSNPENKLVTPKQNLTENEETLLKENDASTVEKDVTQNPESSIQSPEIVEKSIKDEKESSVLIEEASLNEKSGSSSNWIRDHVSGLQNYFLPRENLPDDSQTNTFQTQTDGDLSNKEKHDKDDDGIPLAPPQPQSNTDIKQGVDTKDDVEDEEDRASAMNLVWCFGANKNIKLLNLSTEKRKLISYACGHSYVLYDLVKKQQRILQGHVNNITSTAVSRDKCWLATADSGYASMINIWDTSTGIPIQTIHDAHPDGGVAGLAMTPDSRYIASLSHCHPQTFAIWDWTIDTRPICTATLDQSYGMQTYIYFNPFDISQIVSNSDHQVIFYKWENTNSGGSGGGGGDITYFAPPLTNDDFKKPVGVYSQSIFLENSTRALTATSIGNLVVWDTNAPITKMTYKPTPNKKALKLIKLQEKGISVLTLCDGFIVIGDHAGHVKFFDSDMKLIMWYSKLELGPILSLCFSYIPTPKVTDDENEQQVEPIGDYPPDATIKAMKFKCRDFAISTQNGFLGWLQTDGSKLQVIDNEHDADIRALTSHPSLPLVAASCDSGLLKIWNYETKQTVLYRQFKGSNPAIKCMAFHPDGSLIALGFVNGYIRIVDAASLDDVCSEKLRVCRCCITKIAFAHNGTYLACVDTNYTTTVLTVSTSVEEPYKLVGRYRAHHKTVTDIMFVENVDTGRSRLFTLSLDRNLVEYDLEGSQLEQLRVKSIDRIEQDARPLCITPYGPITKEQFFATSNDQFKFKLYNSVTKMCRKTVLGPTFGAPIQEMKLLPTLNSDNQQVYMAFISADKLGIYIIPFDGNPHRAMAVIAHPSGVHGFCSSFDGKYLFSTGGTDMVVHMWKIRYDSCEAQLQLGGSHMDPFYTLIDGGRDGELYKELEDYFYYSQIRGDGINKMQRRKITDTIKLTEIPYVMRAMGFFPSEQQIDDMINELKYSSYVESGNYKERCTLEEFILLYINHRQAFGLKADAIKEAFEKISDKTRSLKRQDLIDYLQKRGEHMTEMELVEYLVTLLGGASEGGNCEAEFIDAEYGGDFVENNLPVCVTDEFFANDLLNLQFYDTKQVIEENSVFKNEAVCKSGSGLRIKQASQVSFK